MADPHGGLIATTWAGGVRRIGGPSDAPDWEFIPSGGISSSWRQNADGVLFAIEDHPTEYDVKYVIGVNGSNGQLAFRIQLPVSTSVSNDIDCQTWLDNTSTFVGAPTDLVIGDDGAAHFPVSTVNSVSSYLPCGVGSWSRTASLDLWRVTGAGSVSTTAVWTYGGSGSNTTPHEYASFGNLARISDGSVVLTWSHTDTSTGTSRIATKVTGGSASNHSIGEWQTPMFADHRENLYMFDGSSVTAIDTATWSTLWTESTDAYPVQATGDGGLVVSNGMEMTVIDEYGVAGSPVTMPLENPVSLIEHGQWTGLWYNEGTEAYELASMVGPEAGLPPSAFAAGQAPLTPHRLTEHSDADRAAIVTLRYYLGPTVDYNREFAGFICKLGTARYSASIANPGTSHSSTPRRCGFTFRNVAWESAGVYHTHTPTVDEGFSAEDALGAKNGIGGIPDEEYSAGKHSYWIVPCGQVRRWKYLGADGDEHHPEYLPMVEKVELVGCSSVP